MDKLRSGVRALLAARHAQQVRRAQARPVMQRVTKNADPQLDMTDEARRVGAQAPPYCEKRGTRRQSCAVSESMTACCAEVTGRSACTNTLTSRTIGQSTV